MRKAIGVVLAGLSLLLLTASPALALRDPFDPVVKPDSAGTGTTTGTTTIEEPDVTTNENPFSDGMPNTGADTAPWLVLSYVLVVLGGAALALAWTRRSVPAGRQLFRS